MKKILLFFAALGLAWGASAQPELANVSELYVYGVDFSVVKVVGAEETVQQFATTFPRINQLLVDEPSKYDFAKAFRMPIAALDITPTQTHNQNCDYTNLKSMSTEQNAKSAEEIQQMVENYQLSQSEGTGVVLIALTLDKGANKGTYQVVFFDVANRNIILSRTVTAKAGGFGLRNYWAGSVYNVLKSWKKQF